MARVERYTSTEPITVKQAGMIDPSDFRFSNISAQMLRMGGEVLYELGRRELEAKNSLAINQAVESRNLAKLNMREFMANNPDPDTWAKGAEKILAEQGKIYSQQRFNAKTRAEQEIEQQAFKDKLNTEVGIAAVTQNIENDIAISGKNLIDVISTDDGTPEMAADILDQQKTYQEALERKYPKKVAAIFMDKTLLEAEKQSIENAINEVHAAIEENDFKTARELAKNSLIPETKQTALRNTISSAEKAIITAREIEQELKDDEIGNEFLELLINKLDPTKPQLTYNTSSEHPDLSFDAKGKWFTKLMIFDNYSEGELKEAFTDKGEVLAEIYDKIDAGTLTDELDTMVGKGLSPVTAQRIKGEIRKPFESRTDKLFKTLFGWQPELGFPDEMSSFLYLKSEREWRMEVKKQDAIGEDIVNIGKAIVRPYFVEHLQTTMAGQTANIPRMVELALGAEIKEEEEVPEKEEEPVIPTIQTKEEYDALPSGSIYNSPDGERRRKP